ncbi:hypothetical protein [Allobaculum sp. JKK-2023]|uniref:hypothetical protein n=1 Tax=Allobaculum sp. JKK-2023 TaxID=3108943 RepID=UPI002B0562B3|nr:hypothetical protein [Allobaculum sp. JKK-2023]
MTVSRVQTESIRFQSPEIDDPSDSLLYSLDEGFLFAFLKRPVLTPSIEKTGTFLKNDPEIGGNLSNQTEQTQLFP